MAWTTTTLPATDVLPTSCKLWLSHTAGRYVYCRFEYYTNYDPSHMYTPTISSKSPFSRTIYGLDLGYKLWYRGMTFRPGTPWYKGEWLVVPEGVNEIHFRAFGMDPQGNIIYGEDMSFEY